MEVSTNLGRVSLVPRGEYEPAAEYARLDVVQYGGSGYLVLRPVQGVTPEDGENYMLLAGRGEPGKKGDPGQKGDPGAPGPQGKGFVIKGYYPSLGSLEAAVPSPEEGDSYGVGGADPYDIYTWDAVHEAWVNNGTIQGPPGHKGDPGPAFTYDDFTPEQLEALRGPKGDPGTAGKSAWQYAQEGGYAGTEEEFGQLLADAATKTYVDDLIGDIASILDSINGEAA